MDVKCVRPLASKRKSVVLYRFSTEIFVHIMPVCYGLVHVARSGSVYVTMAVTIERYFAIVHPLKDFKMKKALLPLAMAFAIIYNIPKASQKSFSIVKKNWLLQLKKVVK